MPHNIKLNGEKGERFEEIKTELAEELGYEPSNPEVLGLLMAMYPGTITGPLADVPRSGFRPD